MAREAFVRGGGIEFDPTFAEVMVKLIDEDTNKKANNEENEIETEITCNTYREQISCGIPVEYRVMKVTFDYEPLPGSNTEFSAPSLVLFDSYDRRVHTNDRSIEAYKYTEYGELWFDTHSITTAARQIKETLTEVPEEDGNKNCYEILMGRYEDHVKLIMKSPSYKKEVIVVLPNSSKSAYIGLTGEACSLSNINVEETEQEVKENDIPRIADEISYINRMESDIKNVQVERPRSAYTEGVEIKDRRKILFHTMSLPGAGFVWHCPYVIIFSSDDGRVEGRNYKEYAVIKLYGENDGDLEGSENSIYVKRTDKFPGWEEWKRLNKEGMECEISLRKKSDKIILKTENLGIDMEHTTILKEAPPKVYVALTGDQVALTDIRVM